MTDAPCIYPAIRYHDARAAIDWLVGILGFTNRVTYEHDGKIAHAELSLGSSILMLGEVRDGMPQQAALIYVAVRDPDALCERVRASGAVIEQEPYDTDYGSREFACRDFEGNQWSFGTYWPKVGEPPL